MAEKTDPKKAADLAELDKLQKRYDTLKQEIPHTYNGEKQAELLREKGDLVRSMDVIKRKHDVQPESVASTQGEPNADRARNLRTPGAPAEASPNTDDDPVSEMNAPEAIDSINRMRSKEKLQAVVDNDPRASVKEAAKQKLASL